MSCYKVLCIFAYCESRAESAENLRLFCSNAILPYINYFVVLNGPCSIEASLENLDRITIVRRENRGFDFAAYMCVLNNRDLIPWLEIYDYFVFLNSSVRYVYQKDTRGFDWFSYFETLFHDYYYNCGPSVDLVGVSINVFHDEKEMYTGREFHRKLQYHLDKLDAAGNGGGDGGQPKNPIFSVGSVGGGDGGDGGENEEWFVAPPPYTHVQSQFFVLNRAGMAKLWNAGFWSKEEEDDLNCQTDMKYVISLKEIMMSQILLRARDCSNINARLSRYRGIDYTRLTANINPSAEDPYGGPGCYFGRSINPFEAIFHKTNRGIPVPPPAWAAPGRCCGK